MVSIVIVHYKTKEILRLALQYLQKNLSLPYEVIIIDYEPEVDISEFLNDLKLNNLRVFAINDNWGYAKGVNFGVKKARYEYIFIMNPDIIVEKGSLEKLLNYIKQHKNVGIVAPRLLSFNGKLQYSAFRFYSPLIVILRRLSFLTKVPFFKKKIDYFLMKDKNIDKLRKPIFADWVMGSAMFTTKDKFLSIGGMDESFFMYFEDVDLCRSFWENGLSVVYHPDSFVYHYHMQASKKFGVLDLFLNKMTYIHIKSAFLFFKKRNFKVKNYS